MVHSVQIIAYNDIHIVYDIESAVFMSSCQKPEQARYKQVRTFDTLCHELFITHNTRIFIEIVF